MVTQKKQKQNITLVENKIDNLCRIPRGICTNYKAEGAELRIKITGQHWMSVPVRRPGQLSPVMCFLIRSKYCSKSSLLYQLFINPHRLQLPEIYSPCSVDGSVDGGEE